jgi:hypothetical protein
MIGLRPLELILILVVVGLVIALLARGRRADRNS